MLEQQPCGTNHVFVRNKGLYIYYYTVYLVYCEASLVWFFCLLLMHGQVIAGTTPQGRTFKSCFVREARSIMESKGAP